MNRVPAALVIGLFALATSPVLSAPNDVVVTIRDGRASVTARNATVTEVLEAWSRAGGTTIVNGEQLNNARLTLQLVDVPEEQALDVILRPASGYIARTRSIVLADASRFDRVVILARSVAPQPALPVPPPPSGALRPMPSPSSAQPETVERLIGPDGAPVPDDQEGVPPAPRGFSPGDEPPGPPGFPGPSSRFPAPSSQRTPAVGVPVPGMIVPTPSPPPPER